MFIYGTMYTLTKGFLSRNRLAMNMECNYGFSQLG